MFSGTNFEILSGGRTIAVEVGCGSNLYRLATKETACLTTIEGKHIKDCQHEGTENSVIEILKQLRNS